MTAELKSLLESLELLSNQIVARDLKINETSDWHNIALGILKNYAVTSKAHLPQYNNYFGSWVLGRVKRELEFKGMEEPLPAGDLVLMKPICGIGMFMNRWETSVFSPRSETILGVSIYDLELL